VIPPQVMAALQAQHGAPPGAGPPPGVGGPPPGPPGPPPGAQSGGGGNAQQAIQYLRQAIQSLHQAQQAEPDPEDQAVISKTVSLLMQMIAKDQKEKDAALGTTPAHKSMRNAAGGPGY
jgi:hypothetical protein